jgi:hypothetical protein
MINMLQTYRAGSAYRDKSFSGAAGDAGIGRFLI